MHIVISAIIFYYYITMITCYIFVNLVHISLFKSCNYVQCNHIYTHVGVVNFSLAFLVI